jgi:hypothetical protein
VNGLGYILDLVMAKVLECVLTVSPSLLVCRARYTYAAWLSQLLNPRCQIDAFTIYIVPVVYDFAQVDANPELQARIFGQFCVPRKHLTLEIVGDANRSGNTLKLCQNGIPGLMNLATTMRCNHISEQVEPSIKLSVGFFLIEPGKTAISGNVGVEDYIRQRRRRGWRRVGVPLFLLLAAEGIESSKELLFNLSGPPSAL